MTFEALDVSLDENCFSDFIKRYHFNEEDKNEIIKLYRKVHPRVHAIFHHIVEEDENGGKVATVVASLGRAFDEYQNVLVRQQDIHGAYIVDCLGLELLSKAYDQIDVKIHEMTGLYAGGYIYAGSKEFPLEEIPVVMKKLGQKKIRYNEAYMLLPKKSVLFTTKLYDKKQESHSKCAECNAVNCSMRVEKYKASHVDNEAETKASPKEKGLIHLYTGEGKGKTTAAIGLSVRAAGAGKKVIFSQFMKGRDTSELNSFEILPNITVIRKEEDMGWFKKDDEESIALFTKAHNEILDKITDKVRTGKCDVLVLDEVTYPWNFGIIDKARLQDLIANKPENMEIVLTGRNADDFFVEHADYITRMEKVKHPFDAGIQGRLGIEF